MNRRIYLLAVLLMWMLMACRVNTIMRSAAQERDFRQRYAGKSFYTAVVLQPYNYGDDYLIDLTGKVSEIDDQSVRTAIEIPLGTPITITDIEDQHVIAHIVGHKRPFRILVNTKRGKVDDLAKELALLITEESPLSSARSEFQSFIERGELTQGMSQQEIHMSWGHPDKVNTTSGPSGFLEEWIYFRRQTHLFLQNGYLTNWQQY